MKIVMLTNFYNPHIGGVEKHVREISKIFTKKGYSVDLITSKYDKAFAGKQMVGKVNVTRINYPNIKFLGIIIIWYRILSLFKLFKRSDIIHIHDVFIWFLPLIIFFRRKSYITFHGYDSYPLKFKSRLFVKLAWKLTSGSIAVGEHVNVIYKIKADMVTYGGVDVKKIDSERNNWKYDALFIGRLDKQTGFDKVILAVNEVKKSKKNFRFSVIGEGEFLSLAKKSGNYLGLAEDPLKFMKQSKIIIASGFLTILEGFSLKKKVFTLYSDPIKKISIELSPFKNFITMTSSYKVLADNILDYYNRNKSDTKLIQAYNWVKTKTWENLADNYIKLWKKN